MFLPIRLNDLFNITKTVHCRNRYYRHICNKDILHDFCLLEKHNPITLGISHDHQSQD